MSFWAFAQLVTTFIFFSAWDRSHVKWDNSQNLTKTNEDLSVDIVDVAPTNREFGEVGQFMKNPSALYQKDDEIDGIVLNAMKLQVESEK